MGVGGHLSLRDIRSNPCVVPSAVGDSAMALCSSASNVPAGRRGADANGDERSEVLSCEGKLKKLELRSLEERSINNTPRGQKKLL